MDGKLTENGRIYLDHNATTPLHPQVLEKMLPFLKDNFGNASSIHSEGRTARVAVDRAREEVAALLGAEPEEIYFTSGGTEGNNLAIRGTVEAAGDKTGRHLIASAIEHHAVLRPMERLARQGFELSLLPVDYYGSVDPEDLRLRLRPGETLLASVLAASNEVGTVQPTETLGAICRENGVLFHVDAVQAAGRLPLDVRTLAADLLSISAHKIYGPKGVGALFVRKGVEVEPQMLGGGQERRRRSGTENVPGIVGLGAACGLARIELEERNRLQLDLRDRLYQGIRSGIDGVHLNGHPTARLSNTLNVSFEGVEGEALLIGLDMKGIAASSGSACASGSLEPSHVLSAMGLQPELAHNSVRFSLGRGNTAEQIDRVTEELVRIIRRLRSLRIQS